MESKLIDLEKLSLILTPKQIKIGKKLGYIKPPKKNTNNLNIFGCKVEIIERNDK